MNAEIQKKQRTKAQHVSAFLNSLSHADISSNDLSYKGNEVFVLQFLKSIFPVIY